MAWSSTRRNSHLSNRSSGQAGPVGNLEPHGAALVFARGHEFIEREFPGGRKLAAAALHQAQVLGDTQDPGAHAFRLAKLLEILEDPEERLLRYFFGIFTMAAHQPTVLRILARKCSTKRSNASALPAIKSRASWISTSFSKQFSRYPIVAGTRVSSAISMAGACMRVL